MGGGVGGGGGGRGRSGICVFSHYVCHLYDSLPFDKCLIYQAA